MRSLTVLTPLYHEEVLYALDGKLLAQANLAGGQQDPLKHKPKDQKAAAGAAAGAAARAAAVGVTDLLSEDDESVSLMTYLRCMYTKEWRNFCERWAALLT